MLKNEFYVKKIDDLSSLLRLDLMDLKKELFEFFEEIYNAGLNEKDKRTNGNNTTSSK